MSIYRSRTVGLLKLVYIFTVCFSPLTVKTPFCSFTHGLSTPFLGKTISQSPLNSEKRAYIGNTCTTNKVRIYYILFLFQFKLFFSFLFFLAAFSSFGALMFIICLLGAGWLHYKNKNNVQESDVTNERRLTFDTDC